MWVLVLAAGSFLPDHAKDAIGTHAVHRLYHLVSFGSTAYLLSLIARDTRERFAASFFVIALGCALEYGQHVVFHIPIEWWDIRDDTLGVLAAALLIRFNPWPFPKVS
jgi:hypothetical protein